MTNHSTVKMTHLGRIQRTLRRANIHIGRLLQQQSRRLLLEDVLSAMI